MDGFELCRQWKADDRLRTIPFIFYTATYTDRKDEQFARFLGADRFIVKPQKPENLLAEIKRVLEESSQKKGGEKSSPEGKEQKILREYNEVLFRKLEKKVMQLETEIAERKAAEQQREAVIGELERKNEELTQFTYTISHELRTPLITIKCFSQRISEELSENASPEELKGHIRHINDAVDMLDSLLSDILKQSHAGRILSPMEQVGFGAIVHESVALFAQPLADRGVRIVIDPDFPVVTADRARIREVLCNLIENSLKFYGTQKNPYLRIGVDMSGNAPVFFVQDNGIGINPRYLERVFNLFEKLDSASPGTGVGLTIARKIIEAHGGKIWAESEGEGKGATFRFMLQERAADRV
jgi:light-regulated signal transduction histidine kinase (bacteriophytochrome)